MIETLVGTRETVHHKTDTHVRLYIANTIRRTGITI